MRRTKKGARRGEKGDADLRRREKGKGESEKEGEETREGGCRLKMTEEIERWEKEEEGKH